MTAEAIAARILSTRAQAPVDQRGYTIVNRHTQWNAVAAITMMFGIAACGQQSPTQTQADVAQAESAGAKDVAEARSNAATKMADARKTLANSELDVAHEGAEVARSLTVAKAEAAHKVAIERCEAATGDASGGFGISDTGISGFRAGRQRNRRDEVHEEAET